MDNKLVYFDKTPSFKEYDLININEGIQHLFKNQLNANFLYIKGINKIEDKKKTTYHGYLLKDYLKLGKELYNLAKQNKIKFEYMDEINNSDFESHYLENIMFEINFTDNQREIINQIGEIYDDIFIKLSNNKSNFIYSYVDYIDDSINSLFLLYNNINYEIDNYLISLLELLKTLNIILDSSIDDDKIISTLEKIKKLSIDIESIKDKNKFDLKNKISLALKKPKKYTINKYFDIPPLTVIFNINQLPEIKKIILKWVNEYGLPYYIAPDASDESSDHNKTYKEKVHINTDIAISEDNYLIPCEDLILSSIFCYMIYSIRTDWKKTDKGIKYLFGFKDDDNINNNSKKISDIIKLFDYYNTYSITIQYGFDCSYYIIDTDKQKNLSDNYFSYYNKDTLTNEEKIFNNICLASYFLVKDSINMKDNNLKLSQKNKQKQCHICNKWFTPNKELKKYCCIDCKKIHQREKGRIKKQRQRSEKKLNG